MLNPELNSLKNSLLHYNGREDSLLIVNKGSSYNPQWIAVQKVNGFVYFILFLLCALPYTTRQANKTTLAYSLSNLLARDPTIYQLSGCQILCRKLKMQPPPGQNILPGIQGLPPALPQASPLRRNQEKEESVRSYFQGKRVVFLSGTPSSTLLGIKALMVQGLPGQLMATMDLARHGVIPLAGTFGVGAKGVEGFNKHAISGTDSADQLPTNWYSYANKGASLCRVTIKNTELATINRYVADSTSFSPDTFLRAKAAVYRLKMLSLLQEEEVSKLAQSIRERLQEWEIAHPRLEHWEFNTAFLEQPIQPGSVEQEPVNITSLQRGLVVVCTHQGRDTFGLVLTNSPLSILINSTTILDHTTRIKSLVHESLFPPNFDDLLPMSEAIVAKVKPYMTFEEDIEDLIETLQGLRPVYTITSEEFDEYAKTPFPIVFGSTDMKEKKLTPTCSHVTVQGGAILGEHLDFVLVRRTHMEKVKTFFKTLDEALSEALPDEAPHLCLSKKIHIFPVDEFAKYYGISHLS